MPFARPTLSELRGQVAADIAAGLGVGDALLRYSNVGILGDAFAAVGSGLYGYLDWIARQSVPFTAEGEFLEAWAALKGVIRKPATAATGEVTFSGTNGKVVPMGTALIRSDGATFLTTAEATIVAGSATVTATAAAAGGAGATPAGAMLTLSIGISGISSSATTLSGFAGGGDVEDDDTFRTRMLAVYAAPPQGGSAGDYVTWALEAPGVTRAWVTRNGQGPGTVVVYFMMDEVEAAFSGFPQGTNGVAVDEDRDVAATGDQLVVADAIYPLQPVAALVYAVAPGQNLLDFTIAGIPGAAVATRAAISAAIDAALLVAATPGGVTQLSLIEAAIARVPAAAGFVITAIAASHGAITLGAVGNIQSATGYLPLRRTVSFV